MQSDLKNGTEIYNIELTPDKNFFLELIDNDKQNIIEKQMLFNTLTKIKSGRIDLIKNTIETNIQKIKDFEAKQPFNAEDYRQILILKEQIERYRESLKQMEKLSNDPYFARIDLYDNLNKYFKLYIGKKGDRLLGIMDWRAPLAKKYYQKSSLQFSYNEYIYKVILRRAYKINNDTLEDWKNEYLNLRDFLTKEEIAGRDESLVFDPFLKEILAKKKEGSEITDIIETIQEKQYEIITMPKTDNLIVQGCAGSGKTMILLHRMSYLMYNNSDIKPEHILLLTPSASFNEFIDELCNILEIDKVKTNTIYSYYSMLLNARGIDLDKKIDFKSKEPESYLKYIYSDAFVNDAKTEIKIIVDSLKEFFTCNEFLSLKQEVFSAYKKQNDEYKKLKNAPKHIIKAVLGEIKMSKEQNIIYTRQFRRLMSEMGVVIDFLQLDFNNAKFDNYYYFFSRYREFFESFKFITKHLSEVYKNTINDITEAESEFKKQVDNLKKYKVGKGADERLLFSDKISFNEKIVLDYQNARKSVEIINNGFDGIIDLVTVIKSSPQFIHSGNAEKDLGLARFLYSEIIKKIKTRHKLKLSKMYKSDLYVMTQLLFIFSVPLKLGQSYVFIDEGQDISKTEFSLIKNINNTAAINIFGDTVQNIYNYKGIKDWTECGLNAQVLTLNQNYRNTNQIVEFVKSELGINMQAIGFDGKQVGRINYTDIIKTLYLNSGIKAVIADEKKLLNIYKGAESKFNIVENSGRISKSKINLLTVAESKGLEFSIVAVDDTNMNLNEKYIAYTRALKELYIIGE
jgi:DNA helicase IV